MGDIQTNLLLHCVHAEQSQHVEKKEVGRHDGGDPPDNPKDAANLGEQELAIPAVKHAVVSVIAVSGLDARWLGEKSDGDAAPDTVPEVDGDGIDGVVDLELHEELGPEDVRPSGDDADDEGAPGGNDGAARGDSNETGEGAVHAHGDVVGRLAGLSAMHDHVGEHGRDGTGRRGDGRGDGGEGADVGVTSGRDREGGSGVEAVPSHPEDEGSEDLEGDAVGREVVGLGELVSVGVVEAADARTEDLGGDEGGDASRHVNDAGAGEVVHAAAEGGIVVKCREESGCTPDGVDDDGVDESREHEGVAEVGLELTTLGDCSRHDGSGRRRERELEEKPDEVSPGGHAREEEVGITDEALLGPIRPAVREGVSDRPKSECASARVEDVLEHDVLDVLLTDGSGTKHGESGLHEENHGGGEEEVEDIESAVRLVGVGEGRTDESLGGALGGSVLCAFSAEAGCFDCCHDELGRGMRLIFSRMISGG
mmetsp:Transcript_27870/g.50847  ORF Transcript_27870/g.50847 Transcript_27870/m.50847 type:complete len:482 (-) Transcript_27870:29-1474(-)